jgi:hypothetical protein
MDVELGDSWFNGRNVGDELLVDALVGEFATAVGATLLLDGDVDDPVDLLWAGPGGALAIVRPRFPARLLRILLGLPLGEGRCLPFGRPLCLLKALPEIEVLVLEAFDAPLEYRTVGALAVRTPLDLLFFNPHALLIGRADKRLERFLGTMPRCSGWFSPGLGPGSWPAERFPSVKNTVNRYQIPSTTS